MYKNFLARLMSMMGCLSVSSNLNASNDQHKRNQEDSRFPHWLHILESAGVDDEGLGDEDELASGGPSGGEFAGLKRSIGIENSLF